MHLKPFLQSLDPVTACTLFIGSIWVLIVCSVHESCSCALFSATDVRPCGSLSYISVCILPRLCLLLLACSWMCFLLKQPKNTQWRQEWSRFKWAPHRWHIHDFAWEENRERCRLLVTLRCTSTFRLVGRLSERLVN